MSLRWIAAFALIVGALVVPGAAAAGTPRPDVRLTPIGNVDTPTAMAVRPGDEALYVAEQAGRVVVLLDGNVTGAALDIRDRVSSGGEQGLLGLTFSPDGTKLYVHFTNASENTEVEEYTFTESSGTGGRAEPTSRRRILRIRDFESNHNGGQLAFGPDGMLYLGMGDGGGGGDEGEGHAEDGNGQSLDTLKGKIIRIDPQPSDDAPYTIPPDNPFADGGGRPEIWAYGLRNPWRFSFDRETGDLWIGDVGQGEHEEVNVAEAPDLGRGANYGWNVFEGKQRYRQGAVNGTAATRPLFQLSHDDGNCSVIGGFVYRGTLVPDLVGAYVYTDYCNGELRWARRDGDKVADRGTFGISASSVASFGEDGDGELYVLSQSDGVFRLDPG